MPAPDADGMVEELLADGAEEGLVEAAELRLGFGEGLRLDVGLEQGVIEVHCGRQTLGASDSSRTEGGSACLCRATNSKPDIAISRRVTRLRLEVANLPPSD